MYERGGDGGGGLYGEGGGGGGQVNSRLYHIWSNAIASPSSPSFRHLTGVNREATAETPGGRLPLS